MPKKPALFKLLNAARRKNFLITLLWTFLDKFVCPAGTAYAYGLRRLTIDHDPEPGL
jgi:hypothetical protein